MVDNPKRRRFQFRLLLLLLAVTLLCSVLGWRRAVVDKYAAEQQAARRLQLEQQVAHLEWQLNNFRAHLRSPRFTKGAPTAAVEEAREELQETIAKVGTALAEKRRELKELEP